MTPRISKSGRLLRRLARVATVHPAWTVILAVLLSGAGVGYALTRLTLATSQRELLPQGQPYIQRYVEYSREFGELDDIAIAVEAPSLIEAKEYAARLVRELRARQVPLKRIAYRIIAGFGSLMLADHRGIFGLGLLITLGTASSLVAALVVLPVLLRMVRPRAAVRHAEAVPSRA